VDRKGVMGAAREPSRVAKLLPIMLHNGTEKKYFIQE
jgi:hypothetical protein